MEAKDELGEAIREKLGLTPGQVIEKTIGISRTDTSKIRRKDWGGISMDRMARLGLMVGVKLVYTVQECEPVRPEGKVVKSKFDVDAMNLEVF